MLHTRGWTLVFCATAIGFGQEASRKQLTARELFYAATQPAKTEAVKPDPPKAAPPKSATTKSAPPRSNKTPPKPVEIARAESQNAGVVIPVAAQTAPLPANGQPVVGLRITVMRYNSDDTTTDLLPHTAFPWRHRAR